jgi:hypothetical protein
MTFFQIGGYDLRMDNVSTNGSRVSMDFDVVFTDTFNVTSSSGKDFSFTT